ncbi:Methyl-accepting chemotaxis protein, putative [Shewanella piezotolerans WP3]|uniref:Methyl-accepting chemotaxis protein, putative n=1 Tax=Shewanella piezotolerans (strain WP3 / JCM 13877) TaxID=225849 RepID=B8CQY6_SHEPW|nr:methyl-accepting chemotaxis protein [Shewanella piezotolerans]ACJ29658.1 Methyl-accepting chemotaxis protein, putative [Shewanella piezotolerans WP3]
MSVLTKLSDIERTYRHSRENNWQNYTEAKSLVLATIKQLEKTAKLQSNSMNVLRQLALELNRSSQDTANLLASSIVSAKEDISALSGLALDGEPSGFYLAELYINRIAQISEYYSLVTASASNILQQGRFTPQSYTQIVALNKRLAEQQLLLKKSTNRLYTTVGNTEMLPLKTALVESAQFVDSFVSGIEMSIISPDNFSVDLAAFHAQSNAGTEALDSLGKDTADILQLRIQNRLDRERSHMFWLIITALFVVIFSVTILLIIYKAIVDKVDAIEAMTSRVAKGDFTADLKVTGNDELSKIAEAINHMLASVRMLITGVKQVSLDVVEASEKMQLVTSDVESTLTSQQAQTHSVAEAITQMVHSADNVERCTYDANQVTSDALHSVQKGNKVISSTVNGINKIAEEVATGADVINQLALHSSDIGKVVNVIRAIAEQTNLLALNAAIEAARAGEQGRGFAVVADEVRTLASRTQSSTQEIEAMIELVQKGARQAVKAMEAGSSQANDGVKQARLVSDSMATLASNVEDIVLISDQITESVEAQRQVSTTMDTRTHAIKEGADLALIAAKEASSIGKTLAKDSQRLALQISGFSL